MKNLYKIILILVLAANALHLDISAAGKRKAEKAPENESHCSKRGVRGTDQEKLDWVLFNAARTGNSDAVEKLLNMNANPSILINGCTALHIAARNHNFNCIHKLLASKKVKVDARADNFMTPLHEIVCISKGEKHKITEVACVVKLIDEWGAKVNAQNSDKNTPLHLATMYGHDHYVVALLGPYPDHTLRNAKGKTPLMIAEEKGLVTIIKRLKKVEKRDKKNEAKEEEMDIS